jgi:tRNA threonylcarbamoyladenosine biosynthesis protein TsaB
LPLLLALETSNPVGSVALLDDSGLAGERPIGTDRAQHAAAIIGAIDELLRMAGRDLEQVERIALSIGPGSFTGLRIGLATALGLCFGTARRIVPVSTLAALSTQAGNVDPIAAMLDARRGEVYCGLYAAGGVLLEPDRISDPRSWIESLRGRGPVHFLGSGARAYAPLLRQVLGADARLLPAEQDVPRASSVGRLGQRGVAVAAEEVQLAYLRPSEAEEKRAAGHTSANPIESTGTQD